MCCWGWEDTKNLFTEESLWKVSRFSRRHILQPVNFNAQHSWTRKFCEKYLLCKTESTSKDPFENSFQNFHALCHISCIPIQYAFVSYLLCQIYWGFSCITILHQLKEFEIKEEWYWISKCENTPFARIKSTKCLVFSWVCLDPCWSNQCCFQTQFKM